MKKSGGESLRNREALAQPSITFYQCCVSLSDVKPGVWRRFLIPAHLSLAQLHDVLQILMGWNGECLHRFHIHGKDYGINYVHGIWFCDDAKQVRLSDFRLRKGERFTYEYDFISYWKHDIRIEKVLKVSTANQKVNAGEGEMPRIPRDAVKGIPVCIAAEQGNPPEWIAGPAAYMQWLENCHSFSSLLQIQEDMRVVASRVQIVLDGGEGPSRDDDEFAEALDRMEQYLEDDPETYSRRDTNVALRKLAKSWAESEKSRAEKKGVGNALSDSGQHPERDEQHERETEPSISLQADSPRDSHAGARGRRGRNSRTEPSGE